MKKRNLYFIFVLLCSFFINLEITNALNVSNCHGVMARLFNNSYEDGDVILTNDINENDGSYCEDYENGGFYQINFRENQERTIDLNGYTLNLKHRFEIYADEGTVLNIIDSSEEKTGKLIIPSIDLFPCDSESCYNVEINIDGGNYIADTLIKTYDAEYIQTFNFSNARFKGNTFANGSFDKVNIKNAIIEPKTDNITFMYNEYDFSLNEVIEKNYKVLNSGKEVELSKSISELASKDNIYVVKDNKYIYITDFNNVTYGYEIAESKPIAFVNSTDEEITIKKVIISNTNDFILNGSEIITLKKDESNATSYTVEPKIGLDAGKYYTDVIIIDSNNNYYVSSVNFFVEEKNILKPEINGLNVFEYTGEEINIDIKNFDSETMNITGTTVSKEVGDYSFTITPKRGYKWIDNSTEEIVYNWSIKKTNIVEEIIINGENIVKNNTEYVYTTTINPENASNKNVIWSVENGTGRATISSDGKLLPTAIGTVTIKATAIDGSEIFSTKEVEIINPVEKIIIKSPKKYLQTSTSIYLTAYVFPSNATYTDVTWSSSNTSIATIDPITGGLSTKNKVGTVKITATAKDGTGVIGTIELEVGRVSIKINEETSLGNTNYISYDKVMWEIEDESIITATGKSSLVGIGGYYKHSISVKGLKTGSTSVKMKTISGDVLATSIVYVYSPITSIESEYKSLKLELNETKNLNITILPQNVDDNLKKIIYTSTNDNVVDVDQNGLVKAKGIGEANIIIYSEYYDMSLTIPVKVETYPNDIILNTTQINLSNISKIYNIEYQLEPSDVTNKDIIFEIENKDIATVTNTGKITAKRNGETNIIIKTANGKITKTIKLNVEGFNTDVENFEYNTIADLTYDRTEKKPEVIIKDDEYTLVENIDYTIQYYNNINPGFGEIVIKGINYFTGSKIIKFKINEAKIEYSADNKEIEYDRNKYGIFLSIKTPDVIVKYANSNGEYILDEMPMYIDVGTYTIYFKLLKEHHITITDSKKLTIKKANLRYTAIEREDFLDGYDSWTSSDYENLLSVWDLNEDEYTIKFADDFGNYTLSKPKITNKTGQYLHKFEITSPNYNTVRDSIYSYNVGISGLHESLSIGTNFPYLFINDFTTDFNVIKSRFYLYEKTHKFGFYHLSQTNEIINSDIVKTGDQIRMYADFWGGEINIHSYFMIVLGDVNCDGKISALDYVKIKNHIMGSYIQDNDGIVAADLNKDDKISALDYVRIKNYIMKGNK